MSDVRILLMTVPTADVAETIVNTLVDERLIACGNITMPITSIYRWQGETERAGEVLVILKTVDERVARVMERAAELHPYDVPELLSLAVETGHSPYVQWVRDAVNMGQDSTA